jgi:hypothetical protein
MRWRAFKERWHSISRRVLDALSSQLASARVVAADRFPAESEYQELRCTINKSCDDTHSDPGDLFNVIQGIESAAQEAIDERGHPEPTPGDPDLAAFQKLDAAIRASEAAVKPPPKPWYTFMPWWGYGLSILFIGGVGYSFYRVSKRSRADEGARLASSRDVPLMLSSDPDPGVMSLARDPITGVAMPPPPAIET